LATLHLFEVWRGRHLVSSWCLKDVSIYGQYISFA
jgi:hypothetical protein